MAREKTKKDPADYSVEEKLKNLYALQSMLSEIDSIKNKLLRLPDETTVLCGHGPTTTIGYEKQNNYYF